MNKKEIINFLSKKETYDKVLELVNDVCRLNDTHLSDYPLHYFLAGGSVANTIYYLLNKEKFDKPVINDVDLFFFNNVQGYDWYLDSNPNTFIHTELSSVAGVDSYGRTWVGPSGESMRMFGSERFGVINKISINVYKESIQNFNETNFYKTLLTVFDLNCCMAGLDRVNNKIIYTEDFLYFLETNQIEVTNVSQPLQTTIRLKNKTKQLKTNGSNFKVEMDLIKHSFIKKKIHSIGPEWMKKVKLDKEFVLQYFTFDLKNNDLTPQGVFQYTVRDFEIEKYYPNFNISNNKKLIAFWDLFVRKKDKETLKKVLTFYNDIFLKIYGGENISKQETLIYEANSKNLNLGPKIVSGNLDFIAMLSISPTYFDCNYTNEDLRIVYDFNEYIKSEIFSEADIFVVKNIKDHLVMINYVKKAFFDNHGLFKKDLLLKVIYRSKINKKHNLTNLGCDEKIKIFKKLINGLWIKSYGFFGNTRALSHRFLPTKKVNLNFPDFE